MLKISVTAVYTERCREPDRQWIDIDVINFSDPLYTYINASYRTRICTTYNTRSTNKNKESLHNFISLIHHVTGS